MNITVLEELQANIDPLSPDEHAALERSILTEGCRDALALWGDMLVDGHNRYVLAERRAQAIDAAIASLPAEEQKSAALTKEKQALRAQVTQLQAQFQSPETHQAGA